MCGIVALLPSYDNDPAPQAPARAMELLSGAEASAGSLAAGLPDTTVADLRAGLSSLNEDLEQVLALLSGTDAAHALLVDDAFGAAARASGDRLATGVDAVDAWLDGGAGRWTPDDVESVQTELRRTLDLVWAVREDRLAAAVRVRELAGTATTGVPATPLSRTAAVGFWAVDAALDAIDRLEVRGRDSAGIHLWIRLDEADRARIPDALARREDPLFRAGACVVLPGGLSVVFKTASVVGQLGDNVRALRRQLAADADVQAVLRLPSARVTVLSHTRWASVGRVNTSNAHPLNSLASERGPERYAVAVLNGDIDNHLDLREREGLPWIPGITTDAKVIPLMESRRLAAGKSGTAAMADCLREFEGSMAIGLQSDDDPSALVLGVKGGGQGLYVGMSPFGYVVASEIFGLVGWSSRYVSLEALAGDEIAAGGAVVRVDGDGGGGLDGLCRVDAAGRLVPVTEQDVRLAEVTTRDVALRGFDRYLEKELAESPASFRKTLRGRIREEGGRLSVVLPSVALPEATAARLRDGGFDEVVVIGQGTAAVAASGIAHLLATALDHRLRVTSLPSSELSAARLPRDMSRTLIVAVSQSGSTTDTNRTVDLTRARGATVVCIVNRRQSDLVTKSAGVLYTGDGRDIEMAVASTKAFYSQIAAGMLLGLGLSKAAGYLDPERENEYLRMLVEIPGKLEEIQRDRLAIAEVAERVATRHCYWAVVGSGPNRIAAAEVRIKLSELCYRGVALDAVEDKKHIDLSAESLILVCAAGAPVTQVADLIKEVAIFSAHRNTPVVIADRGADHAWPTEDVVHVPDAHPLLGWVLSTAAGHVFCYYAARAIDRAAADLRAALEALDSPDAPDGEGPVGAVDDVVRTQVATPLGRFVEASMRGDMRGVLGSDTGMRLAASYWYLASSLPADMVLAGAGMAGDPLDAVRQTLSDAIEELTRSIDSVKHQAKTVTVGTSRSGAELFDGPLARAVLDLGAGHDALSYSSLLALRAHAPVVRSVLGGTRYLIGEDAAGQWLRVIRKDGIAAQLTSRADGPGAPLSGTKKLAVTTRALRLERGTVDGRTVLLVPELSGQRVSGLTLLHLDLADHATGEELVGSLKALGTRWVELQAAVTEQDVALDPVLLARLPVASVLLAPVAEVAAQYIAVALPAPAPTRTPDVAGTRA